MWGTVGTCPISVHENDRSNLQVLGEFYVVLKKTITVNPNILALLIFIPLIFTIIYYL